MAFWMFFFTGYQLIVQQHLAQMMSRLQKISEEYNIAVFITNQMTADPGANMSFVADPKKPIGKTCF